MTSNVNSETRRYPKFIGWALWVRSKLSELDSQINHWRIQASALPFRHSYRARIVCNIADLHLDRYHVGRQKGDLDQAIMGYGEALLRGFDNPLPTITTFHKLTCALHTRFDDFPAIEDSDYVISYFLHLSSLPLEDAGIDHLDVLNDFANALRSRFIIKGRLEDIEGSISLHRYIITMASPGTDDYYRFMSDLADALTNKFGQTGESGLLTEAIGHHRAVLGSCCPSHPTRPAYLNNFAICLMSRFESTGELNDLEEAAALFQESYNLVDEEDPRRVWILTDLANSYHRRHSETGDLEDLEQAISHYREALPLCPASPNKSFVLGCLARALETRFQELGRMDCLEEAALFYRASLRFQSPGHIHRQIYMSGLARTMGLRFLRTGRMEDLEEEINLLRETLALTPLGHPARPSILYILSNGLGRRGDIDKAIEHLREALQLHQPGHPLSRDILHSLAINLSCRFSQCGAANDIAEAIKYYQTSISLTPVGHPEACTRLSHFAMTLSRLFLWTRNAEHLEESIAYFQSAVEYPFSSVRDRLEAAETWASIAHLTHHPTSLTAYRKALSLLQGSMDLSPTVQTQHEFISGRRMGSLPMDAASCAIGAGAYQEAVEMLEQGRSLLWSSMRSLRTPLEHLRAVDQGMADHFAEISNALEAVITTTDTGNVAQTSSGTNDDDLAGRVDTFSRDLADKRRLSDELEEVILQIRTLPGFENFRRPTPFSLLQTAAIGGPVIIINLSSFRSDILIVRSSQPVVHITTSPNFFDTVTKLAHRLSETRRSNLLESKQYGRVLRQTLETLYELVGQPIVETLRELGIPEQSHIWLCPTFALTSLPIHAAGPIPSDTNTKRYLCDVYVCSYTPSLSALVSSTSRTSWESTDGQPSLLIVGQPDETLPGVDSETRSIESLVGNSFVTNIAGEEAIPENVVAHLQKHPWVHFACHGMLRSGRPFESSFKLQHDTELTLLRITKTNLPSAELAFLAACHTAELTEDGTPDEVLHLTAAMQFCGFRSVIGTMWAMVDEDGQVLSEYFYRMVFAAGAQGARYEQSARALRDATQKLREKRGITLERWVNFVHYGA
ncbi:CHAT domain-containing protein [Lactifluus subvellereus]|nr:CHAT domain-containing protein [Lactifluus subvellereus]